MTSTFVGRAQEMDALRMHLDAAIKGQGHIVVVTGQMGVGKTRLVNELIRGLHGTDVEALSSKCLFWEGCDPFLPMTDMLKRHFSTIDHSNADPRTRPSMESRTPMGFIGLEAKSEGATRDAAKDRPWNIDIARSRERMFTTVTSTILNIARGRPLLMFLDDLQWADGGTIALLRHLSNRILDSRILIICAIRSEDLSIRERSNLASALYQLYKERSANEVKLTPFKKGPAIELVTSMSGSTCISDQMAEWLYTKTEGNPLFLEEMTKSLMERGLIGPQVMSGETGKDMDTIKVPKTLKDLLLYDLEHLPKEATKALEVASVIGTEFEIETLSEVTSMKIDELVDVLEPLVHRKILTEIEDTTSIGAYRFNHKITREVIREGISHAKARLIHQGIAAAIEGSSKRIGDRAVFQLAYHFMNARVHDKALEYSLKAGQGAFATFALEDAREHLSNALALMDGAKPSEELSKRRLSVLISLAKVDFFLGQHEMALMMNESALSIAQELNDLSAQAQIHWNIGYIIQWRYDFEVAKEHFQKCLTLATRAKDENGIAAANNGLSKISIKANDMETATQYIQGTIRSAERIGDKDLLGRCYIDLGNVFMSRGRYEDSIEAHRTGLKLVEEMGDQFETARGYSNMGLSLDHLKEYEQGIQCFDKAIEILKGIGERSLLPFTVMNKILPYLALGETEKALECLRFGERFFEGTDLPNVLGVIAINYGFYYEHLKDWDRSSEHFEKAIRIYEERHTEINVAQLYFWEGEMLKNAGRKEQAISVLEKARTLFVKMRSDGCLELVDALLTELKGP